MGFSAKLAQRARTSGEFSGKHQVIIEYQYKNNRTRFKVEGVYASEKEWNTKQQEISSGYERPVLKELNAKINALKKRISDILHQAQMKDIDPSHAYVKREMGKPVVENTKLSEDVVEMYEIWMNTKGVEKYIHTLPHIKEFSESRGGIKVEDIGYTLMEEFCNFLCTEGFYPYKKESKTKKGKKKKLPREEFSNTTIKNHVKYFRLFIKEYLVRKKYPVDQDFRDFTPGFQTPEVLDVIALTKKEFDTLFYLEITESKKHLQLAKNAFIIGTALGGMRISDLKNLDENKFNNDTVKFRQIKTRGKVENPLSEYYVIPLLQDFLNKRHKIPSGQKFNESLKTLAKMAGINRIEYLEEYRSGRKTPTEIETPVADHISTKYMRKSFISMMVELGVEREIIMEFTGHEDDKILKHYIQVHKHTKKAVLAKFRPDEQFNVWKVEEPVKPELEGKEPIKPAEPLISQQQLSLF